ncbi:hypothetical protein [Leeuwenhoekiella marinoflava]|uniref:Uncharacterized protein n=2 Tax=Leeuwenhoekiella marinoflava TaxID=988 RepID=A0A4Q0PMY0_9FLAO|nr:hypothetical protein [Leeuwenhoekiella marinoflava]RXG31793.1 hypothetical protein DSL99_1617 [Leeuwenhoekiella marinoflava]SHF04961.1 hypothetical protein SAMN02745246_01565 [Leeuwenhoekiella marinoflava DSM 3653]
MSSPFSKERVKNINEKNALKQFLSIPIEDRYYGELYYNEKGEGFFDTFYTDNPEPEKFESDGQIYYINQKGERFDVVKKEKYVLKNQTRLAETTADFHKLYKHHFKESNLNNTEKENEHYKKEVLSPKIKALIKLHKKSAGKANIDAKVTYAANEYLKFISRNAAYIENPHKDVFLDDKAYWIFKELHEIHKDKKSKLANYSRIYWIMKEDKPPQIICSNTRFVELLNTENYNIGIDRIDSRHSGSGNKIQSLYERIRDEII